MWLPIPLIVICQAAPPEEARRCWNEGFAALTKLEYQCGNH
jgi:hypothetical protein